MFSNISANKRAKLITSDQGHGKKQSWSSHFIWERCYQIHYIHTSRAVGRRESSCDGDRATKKHTSESSVSLL